MFGALGNFIYRRRWFVLLAGLVFIAVSAVYGTSIFPRLKSGGFYDPNADSTQVMNALHEKLGRDESVLLVLYTSRDGTKVDNLRFKEEVEKSLALIEGKEGVGKITSYYNTGSSALVSNDRSSTYAAVGFKGREDDWARTIGVVRPLLKSDHLDVQLGGQPAVTEDLNKQVRHDLEKAETLTFPILAILLIFIFASLVAASLPLAIGGIAILGAFLLLRVTSEYTDISIYAINIITMLGLGLAIDYSLFVVSRFREELLRQHGDVQAALVRTLQTAGRTVLFSGLTVAISLLSLMVFPQAFLKSMGLGGTAAVLVAMLTSVTILPAMLALLGERVNSLSLFGLVRRVLRIPASTPRTSAQDHHGFWYRMSSFVMRHPGKVLIATLIPLVIVGLPFLRVKLSVADHRSLPEGAESRVVGERLESDFPYNETLPIQVLVRSDEPALGPRSLSALYDYTRELEKIPGVRRVDSLVNLDPRLNKEVYAQFYSEADMAVNPQAARAAANFSKDNYSLVSVLYDYGATSDEAKDLVGRVRDLQPPAGLSVQVGGIPAVVVDFLDSLGQAMPGAIALIVSVIFVLLFLMLGSVVVPLKAVVLNILSLSVSFGALVWIFQEGNLSNLLNFTSLGSIEGSQPVLIFAIAFGLSMDYEVFLLSRIKEHYDRTGDNTASVALGVQKTGAIITSAALLLVVVFAGFATGEIIFIKMVGIGMALAVLVDATLVRMLLVPATMRLMGDYNWWAPRPLARLYNRLGLSEVEGEEVPSHGTQLGVRKEEVEATA